MKISASELLGQLPGKVTDQRPLGERFIQAITHGSVDMAEIVIKVTQVDSPELVAASRGLFREYEKAIDTNLEYQGFADELASLPIPYAPPSGVLLIAYVGVEVAGCVGLKPLDCRIGEMKRLYVRPAYRSCGLGKRLVDAVILAARHAGYSELRLDTLPSMTSAHRLYHRLGFVEILPYTNKHLPGTRFYSLKLAA